MNMKTNENATYIFLTFQSCGMNILWLESSFSVILMTLSEQFQVIKSIASQWIIISPQKSEGN